MIERAYCGAKIETLRRYKNGNLDVKIFLNREEYSFIKRIFTEGEYKNILNEVKNRNLIL